MGGAAEPPRDGCLLLGCGEDSGEGAWGGGGEAAASSDLASQGQEGVAAALATRKILKEMSHLETEAEVGRTPREAKYEQLALGEQPRQWGLQGPCAPRGPWAPP